MKLYFDTCFYCRPFDNQAHRLQESVEAEIIAIKGVVELCRVFGFDVVGSPDSYHIALAEAVGADYLLTVDIRLISAADKLDLKTKVINPINFLQEFAR